MRPEKPLRGWRRVLFILSLPAAFLLLAWYEFLGGTGLFCPFYRLTGLYCPGCGSGRAVHAVLQGDLFAGFCCNPLLFLLGIPALYCVIHEYIRIAFPKTGLKPIVLPWAACVVCLVLIIGFWVLRNLPWFSFLAPGT